MTSNLTYCFIQASPGEVRRAWKRWTGDQRQEACFIPAQGGCFLVELKAAYSRPLTWLQSQTNALIYKQRHVEQFKKDFESGLLN